MSVDVATSAGTLGGSREGGVDVFRGIPFASPPVGERRFAPPQPVEPWSGVRDATAFGPAAVQAGGRLAGRDKPPATGMFGGMFGAGGLEVAEDCLYLNVWTPACDDRRRPVMVWIHGGAFRMGTGALPGYDGTTLATRGDVVVVTVNYRLGLLGFLYEPALGAVNLGLLDQVAALEWVQREIAAFGGDPDQVTIFGESAGAKSTECLLAMPAAKGLFRRAIVQSAYEAPMTAELAHQRTKSLLAALGTEDPHELRKVPVLRLLEADTAAGAAGGATTALGGGPVVDGTVLPVAPIDALRAGAAAGVDVIVGTTLDESRLFAAFGGGLDPLDDGELRQRVRPAVGHMAAGEGAVDELIEVYRKALVDLGDEATNSAVATGVMTDRTFRQHSISLAEALATHAEQVFMYLFAWKGVALDGKLGACHGIEIPFVFGTLDVGLGRIAGDSPEARALSDRVLQHWLDFAHTGDPGNGWPRYDTGTRSTIVFDRQTRVIDAPLEPIRRFWSGA